MNLLKQANEFVAANKPDVDEQYRPTFHLAPEYGWMNDPNGFVYYHGEYHLFYQSNPYDSEWDTMHWGHAKSKDLIHWEHLPIALAPDQPYDSKGCFSGSAIVVEDELVLIYTGVSEVNGVVQQVQCIASSSDGIHFEKSGHNPVIDQSNLGDLGTTVDFRDPKIFKRNDTYYTVIASKTSEGHPTRGQIFIFSSSDLVNWSKVSILIEGNDQLGNIWECPDLFELDGKDVLILSPMNMPQQGNQYQNLNSSIAMIGEMDWNNLSFKLERYEELDYGLDYYAPQTCLDNQNRRIVVAWQQMWERTNVLDEKQSGWSGMMTLPRVLSIKDNALVQYVPNEFYEYLKPVVEQTEILTEFEITDTSFQYAKVEAATSLEEFSIKIENELEEYVEIILHNNEVKISRLNVNPEIVGKETNVSERFIDVQPIREIEVLIDASSIEILVDGRSLSNTIYFTKPVNTFKFASEDTQSKTIILSSMK